MHPEPELWFATQLDDGGTTAKRRAIAICETCPVRPRCFEHAIRRPELHGIWGGSTPGERRRIVEALGRAWVEPERVIA